MILENAKIILKDKVIDGLDIHSLYLAPGIIELHSHGGGDMTSSMTMMRRS